MVNPAHNQLPGRTRPQEPALRMISNQNLVGSSSKMWFASYRCTQLTGHALSRHSREALTPQATATEEPATLLAPIEAFIPQALVKSHHPPISNYHPS